VDKIKVLIADDHVIFRQGLHLLLEREQDIQVVGEAGDGFETIHQAQQLNPDIILVDISMPKMDGVEVVRRLKKTLPDVKIIILTMYSDDQFVFELLKIWISGYVLKESASNDLIYSIKMVSAGKSFLDPKVSKRVMEKFSQMSSGRDDFERYGKLTRREKEILQLIVEGKSNKEIASKYFISLKTVENHRTNLMRKLNIHRSIDLIKFTLRLGLIEVTP
jgi:DNA-binding NarL/FixJ family response regulator